MKIIPNFLKKNASKTLPFYKQKYIEVDKAYNRLSTFALHLLMYLAGGSKPTALILFPFQDELVDTYFYDGVRTTILPKEGARDRAGDLLALLECERKLINGLLNDEW